MTRNEAESVCDNLGGKLPSVTSYKEKTLLEALMLRSYTEVQIASHAECRFFGVACAVYLGNVNGEVS